MDNIPDETSTITKVGILLSKSTNAWVHDNVITGSVLARSLNSYGISTSGSLDNIGDVIIEDNTIDNVDIGIHVFYASGTLGNYDYYFNRNTVSNANTFVKQTMIDTE